MAVSRIEQLIDDIYEFIESCKMQPLSQTKVIVPKDELYDYLDELKLRTPEEIKRYQKIIANREAIMADAENKAQKIQEDAREKAKLLVNENEIMQQAYYQANEMVQNATNQAEHMLMSANDEAEQIRSGALNYTNDILTEVERIMSVSYEESRAHSARLVNSLKENLDVLRKNRSEIQEQINPGSYVDEQLLGHSESSEDDYDDDFSHLDGDSFLKDIEL